MKYDVMIIGAGPAGTLAASVLNNLGWNVIILEKQKFPRFVIGESLLPRCMDHLKAAGLYDAVASKGFQKKIGARFVRNGQQCSFDFSEQYTQGASWTWQVPRDEFDLSLAEAVQEKGVRIDFESSVEDIEFFDDHQLCTYADKDGQKHRVKSRFVVDGSGYGRVIPRLLGLNKPSDFPPRAAIFAQVAYNSSLPGSDRIDIITVNEDMWAWLIPFSDNRASVGFVGETHCFEGMGIDAESKFRHCAQLEPYLADKIGEIRFVREPQAISAYSVGVSRLYGKGFVLTGNSTEFLDPIFSSGVTFAMESGVKAAELVHQHLSGKTVDWEQDYASHLQRGVDTFRSYVQAWYNGNLPTIIFAENTIPNVKMQICSVLAGYVWDKTNPFVKRHERILATLAHAISKAEK